MNQKILIPKMFLRKMTIPRKILGSVILKMEFFAKKKVLILRIDLRKSDNIRKILRIRQILRIQALK